MFNRTCLASLIVAAVVMYAGYNILLTGFYLDMDFNISYGALEKLCSQNVVCKKPLFEPELMQNFLVGA
jgi:hypothetical protein